MLCPSTPAAPQLAFTFFQAASRVLGAYTLSIKLNQTPPLTPVTSADTMRSVQIDGFHPAQIRHVMPLGFCALFSRLRHFRHCCLPVSVHRASTFLPPFPRTGFATRPSHGLRRSGTMKALTPVPLAQTKQVSPLTPPCLQDIPSPTTSYARTSLCQSPQRVRLVPGFALNEQARHAVPPNRVRFATGCPFASSCSPPRIAATQLLSTSQAVTACGGDLHPADKASSRTHSFPRRREPTVRLCNACAFCGHRFPLSRE